MLPSVHPVSHLTVSIASHLRCACFARALTTRQRNKIALHFKIEELWILEREQCAEHGDLEHAHHFCAERSGANFGRGGGHEHTLSDTRGGATTLDEWTFAPHWQEHHEVHTAKRGRCCCRFFSPHVMTLSKLTPQNASHTDAHGTTGRRMPSFPLILGHEKSAGNGAGCSTSKRAKERKYEKRKEGWESRA